MPSVSENAQELLRRIDGLSPKSARLMIAIAGPPGSGKSTLAEEVVTQLQQAGVAAVLMPMDGFHMDDRLLGPRGLLPRKGAPETFDFGGFSSALARIAAGETVLLPVFDRAREIAIAGAEEIGPETTTVVVEGNYLALDEDPWRGLRRYWDFSAFLRVDDAELERRLVDRWLGYGYAPDAARQKALGNDLPNARRVNATLAPVDLELR